jgi:signal transduction histidine kinase
MPGPDARSRWTTSRCLGPVTVTLALLLLAVNEFGYRSVERLVEQRAIILEARTLADEVRRLTLMMESAKRGHILTGRATYLEPYDEMNRQFEPLLEQVLALARRYPEQRPKLEALVEAARRRQSEMVEVLQRFQSGHPEAAMELTLTEIGREAMVRINEITDDIRREETAAYLHAGQVRQSVGFWSRVGIAGLVLLCAAAVLAVLRLAREREDERGHLARELHDELGGLLTAAKLDVARVRKRVGVAGPEVAERIQHLGQMLDAGIALKRRIIEDLRPSSLANLGLQRTLEIQCREFAARAEIRVQTEIADLTLDAERALAIYRVVQEALTNISRYARASEVHVQLRRAGERVILRVQDNGCGFDPLRVRPGSHGLAGMRFRIRSCGGELVLHSAPGAGTTIEATLPMTA